MLFNGVQYINKTDNKKPCDQYFTGTSINDTGDQHALCIWSVSSTPTNRDKKMKYVANEKNKLIKEKNRKQEDCLFYEKAKVRREVIYTL